MCIRTIGVAGTDGVPAKCRRRRSGEGEMSRSGEAETSDMSSPERSGEVETAAMSSLAKSRRRQCRRAESRDVYVKLKVVRFG